MSLLTLFRSSSPRRLARFIPHPHFPPPALASLATTRIALHQRATMATGDKPHPLEFLIGTWSGRGEGFYPTIPRFEFFEELAFVKDPAGRPVVVYTQKTRRAVAGEAGGSEGSKVPGPPLHAESGFIRMPGWSNETCELILSQPTGVASVEVGMISGTTIAWETTGIVRSPSAKPPHVTQFMRNWIIDPAEKTFKYTFSMATDNTPLQPHLEVVLTKVEDTA